MTILKCKMCGGSIRVLGESHGICDSCGCEVTLPKIDDDKRALFYDRGNYYRQRGEFDRAYSEFEHIIADDMNDAEIYWCLALCRYGIKYEQDPRSGDYKPTISRMSYNSIFEDPDYLKAIENSDEYTKAIYRKEAGKIARIQDRFLEISRKEEPYDVFICFKAEEDNGQRTKGSVIAQDIYEELTEKGIKVFFSRITLLDKLAEEFEPHIFAALHSAKVMLVVTNNSDHLQAVWVKNEWSRFLSLMDKDASKTLVPVYIDMSPYDLPPEFSTSTHQAIDASRLGYLVDLTKGVMRLLGKDITANTQQMPVNAMQATVKNLLKRAQQAAEDKIYEQVITFTDQVLNIDPENGEAYYFQFLAENRVAKPGDLLVLTEKLGEWEKNTILKRAIQFGNSERKQELNEFLHSCKLESIYQASITRMKAGGYADAKQGFEKLTEFDYKDSQKLLEKCNQRIQHAKVLDRYKKEVGDGKSYIAERFEKECPNEYWEYKELKRKADEKRDASVSWPLPLISGLVFGILGCLVMYISTEAGNKEGAIVSIPVVILYILTIILLIMMWKFVGNIIEAVTESPHALVSLLLTLLIMKFLPDFIYPLLGIIVAIYGIYIFIAGIGWRDAENKYRQYYMQYVTPFEEKVKKEIAESYYSVLDKNEIIKLSEVDCDINAQ